MAGGAPKHIGACSDEIIVLVLATLLAITATLYPFSGKPLPQWPYGLSINTLLSIYVLMMRAAMLFLVAQGMPISWHGMESLS